MGVVTKLIEQKRKMEVSTFSESNFHYTISGRIESEDGELYLLTDDSTKLKIKPACQEILPSASAWQVIPNTTPDGTIASIHLESPSQQTEESPCSMVGRVVVLGKKGKFVQLKVNRPPQKTLRITVTQADPRMKVGQLWLCEATRQGNTLVLHSAQPLES
jgi:hypothetical protein